MKCKVEITPDGIISDANTHTGKKKHNNKTKYSNLLYYITYEMVLMGADESVRKI